MFGKQVTTKDAEELAKELTSDIYSPPMLHGGFDDAPEVDWTTLNATVKEKIQTALTAAEQRGFERGKIHTYGTWETSGRATKQSNFGKYKTSIHRGIGMDLEIITITGDRLETVEELAKMLAAAPSPASKPEGK